MSFLERFIILCPYLGGPTMGSSLYHFLAVCEIALYTIDLFAVNGTGNMYCVLFIIIGSTQS